MHVHGRHGTRGGSIQAIRTAAAHTSTLSKPSSASTFKIRLFP